MNRLEQAIASVKEQRGTEVKQEDNQPRLKKAITLARGRLSLRHHEMSEGDDLEKGVHDAMYHHAMHAKAAHSACYKAGPHDPDHDKKCKEHGKKHEFMFMRHALENARKKAKYQGDVKWKMQKAIDFFDSDAAYDDSDPDYKKACEHYKKGGEFKGHKDDSFNEDY